MYAFSLMILTRSNTFCVDQPIGGAVRRNVIRPAICCALFQLVPQHPFETYGTLFLVVSAN